MKTNYLADTCNGILEFTQDNKDEKIFCVVGTIYGNGDSFARFMTEEEIEEEGWYNAEQWTKDIQEMEIGDTSTFGYFLYHKANVIVRVA